MWYAREEKRTSAGRVVDVVHLIFGFGLLGGEKRGEEGLCRRKEERRRNEKITKEKIRIQTKVSASHRPFPVCFFHYLILWFLTVALAAAAAVVVVLQ